MVKELYVEEAKQPVAWEKQEEFLFDFTQHGIPLPDEFVEYLREQLHYVPAERDPAMVRAEAAWDAYFMSDPMGETPRERLVGYFAEED